MANQDTNTLGTKIKNCATSSFASAMFGKATDINADHDIDYLDSGIKDLLHIGYPTSTITDVYKNKHQYTFNFIAARLIEANDSDSDETKFANLEAKMWKILECLSDCDVVVLPGVSVSRDKGRFNDKLITVEFSATLEVYGYCIEPSC